LITFDEGQRRFCAQHGGKEPRPLGVQPVVFPVELKDNVPIPIGRTTLRFLPCRGRQFSWGDDIKGA
jgi:hypothetical protein